MGAAQFTHTPGGAPISTPKVMPWRLVSIQFTVEWPILSHRGSLVSDSNAASKLRTSPITVSPAIAGFSSMAG
jgi:hypothetical protein